MNRLSSILLLFVGTPLIFFGISLLGGIIGTLFLDIEGFNSFTTGLYYGAIAGGIIIIWFILYMVREIRNS